MNRKWASLAGLVAAAAPLLSLSSCARNQDLVSITIAPPAITYGSAVPAGVIQTPVPLTAYGTYIHPQETKVITSRVTWASDITQVAIVDNGGNLTAGPDCGIANVSASFYTDNGNPNGNVVVASMTVTVDGPASFGCPQGGVTHNLSVDVTGGANGVIASSPAGISCGATCSAAFASGSSVSLSPTPNAGHSFGGWGVGCTTISGTTCSVTMNTDVTVTATFN
jgi:hypothetical protein